MKLIFENFEEVKNFMETYQKENPIKTIKNNLKPGDPYYRNDELIGVVVASNVYVNGSKKTIVLSLKDEKEEMTWNEAMALYKDNPDGWRLPTKEEFALIIANVKEINQSLENNNGELLDGWYWSSSEYDSGRAWRSGFSSDYGLYGSDYGDGGHKDTSYEVRPVLAF